MKKVIIGIVFLMVLSGCSTWNNVQSVVDPVCNVLDLLPFYDKSPRETYVFNFVEKGILIETDKNGTIINIAIDKSIGGVGAAIVTARTICDAVDILGRFYAVEGE